MKNKATPAEACSSTHRSGSTAITTPDPFSLKEIDVTSSGDVSSQSLQETVRYWKLKHWKNECTIDFLSHNLATNSHYRADISCQGKFLPDIVTPERTFDCNRIKPAKLPVCLLGSNAVILPTLFLLQCTGQRTSIFGVFEVIFNWSSYVPETIKPQWAL